MVWYIALVAVLNLGLGYALAVYMERGRTSRQQLATSPPMRRVRSTLPSLMRRWGR